MKYLKSFNESIVGKKINQITLYHQSDNPNLEIGNLQRNKKTLGYFFLSTEHQSFIEREYTYSLSIDLKNEDIFNIFPDEYYYGIDLKIDNYLDNDSNKEDVIKLLEDNIEYFYKIWIDSGTDDAEDATGVFEEKFNRVPEKLELLYWFLTTWNDSWRIIESDIFLNYIESKGFKGFTTVEEGILSVGINNRYHDSIKINHRFDTTETW